MNPNKQQQVRTDRCAGQSQEAQLRSDSKLIKQTSFWAEDILQVYCRTSPSLYSNVLILIRLVWQTVRHWAAHSNTLLQSNPVRVVSCCDSGTEGVQRSQDRSQGRPECGQVLMVTLDWAPEQHEHVCFSCTPALVGSYVTQEVVKLMSLTK